VSSFSIHGERRAQEVEWARLIPGEVPHPGPNARKPPLSVRAFALQKIVPLAQPAPPQADSSPWDWLLPGPMLIRGSWRSVRAIAADFALIALNWLLVGALLVPLHLLFPRVRSFGYAAGSPNFILGIAVLHAALITLIGYSEGLHGAEREPRLQERALGKSVLLATAVMCLTYGLQGAPWTVCALFYGAGCMHFSALLLWRQDRWERDKTSSAGSDTRNVLIVGAGAVGRSVAASVESNPAGGRKICGFLDDDISLENGVIGTVRAPMLRGRSDSGRSTQPRSD